MVKKKELGDSGLDRDVTVLDGTTWSTIQSFRGEVEENFQDNSRPTKTEISGEK